MNMSEDKTINSFKDSVLSVVAKPYHKMIGEIEDPNLVAWIETFVVSSLMMGLSWLINPDDILFLQHDFPWFILAPLFLALRHGFMFGFVSALLFVALTVLIWRMGWAVEHDFSTTVILGLLIVTSLAGEFSDFWQRRLGKVEIESAQRDRRMEEFTRSYHLLRVSHDQLIEKLAGASVSLRQTIANMRQEMLDTEYGSDPLESEAERILALFRRYGAVQSASLYRVIDGQLEVQPLGRLGAVPEGRDVLGRSEIVRESLETKEMISVLSEENGAPRYVDGNILAVVPVGDLSGKLWAALVIYRIPFLKFTEDNLSLIAVMASYLGDLLSELTLELKSDRDHWVDFYTEVKLSVRYARLYGMSAKLVSIELPKGYPDAFDTLLSFRRSLDKSLPRMNRDGAQVALWLMPFSDDFSVAGFQARINVWAKEVFPADLGNELVKFHTFDING
ncbi:MAG: hypothetical protein JKY80_03985, partial [Mariprofundaceae bacterium]|nr:hypothetical protein [Mariprofundaceae bacterium]